MLTLTLKSLVIFGLYILFLIGLNILTGEKWFHMDTIRYLMIGIILGSLYTSLLDFHSQIKFIKSIYTENILIDKKWMDSLETLPTDTGGTLTSKDGSFFFIMSSKVASDENFHACKK